MIQTVFVYTYDYQHFAIPKVYKWKTTISITDFYGDQSRLFREYVNITPASANRVDMLLKKAFVVVAGSEDGTTYAWETRNKPRNRYSAVRFEKNVTPVNLDEIPF